MNETKTAIILNKYVKLIERYIIKTLIALMSLLLILATIQLAYEVIRSIVTTKTFLMDLDKLMDLFGIFLLVLIGIELLDTIKVYFKKHVIHVEVVMLVAIIAVARKIILLDYSKYSGFEILAIASIVVALALGYYLIKRTGGCDFWPAEKDQVKDIIIEEKEFDPETQEKLIERRKTIKQQTTESQVKPQDYSQAEPLKARPSDSQNQGADSREA